MDLLWFTHFFSYGHYYMCYSINVITDDKMRLVIKGAVSKEF